MDDFDRDVYCIGGLPFDAVDLPKTMSRLRDAKYKKSPCFLTTPNLNFLALSQFDVDFRSSVLHSDIVIADGAPIVWIAKLLGIPIQERVAGSTLFEALGKEWRRKMKVYFFGGPGGVAAEASAHINEKSTGLTCVGYHSPGFGTIEEMSEKSVIENINLSDADFLVVALGAKKGQAWIMNNLQKIKVPLVSHLGAVINFEAKRLKRAPIRLQKIGLEWAWRIKEEPHLWRRYWNDGWFLLRFLITKVLPFIVWNCFNIQRLKRLSQKSTVVLDDNGVDARLVITGAVLDPVSPETRSILRDASLQNKSVQLNLAEAEYLSYGMLGLLLLLKKQLDKQGRQLKVIGLQPTMRKLLSWNCLTYLVGQGVKN
jgi:N-acetylglucosaminyldiphosphoundecaprenol N-acetyl-beta-D-mannosaminyltransferase